MEAVAGARNRGECASNIDSSAHAKTQNQKFFKKRGCLFLGGVRDGPAGVLRDSGIGPGGCTVRLRRVSDRDRHGAWQVPVAHTGARADREDDIAGG